MDEFVRFGSIRKFTVALVCAWVLSGAVIPRPARAAEGRRVSDDEAPLSRESLEALQRSLMQSSGARCSYRDRSGRRVQLVLGQSHDRVLLVSSESTGSQGASGGFTARFFEAAVDDLFNARRIYTRSASDNTRVNGQKTSDEGVVLEVEVVHMSQTVGSGTWDPPSYRAVELCSFLMELARVDSASYFPSQYHRSGSRNDGRLNESKACYIQPLYRQFKPVPISAPRQSLTRTFAPGRVPGGFVVVSPKGLVRLGWKADRQTYESLAEWHFSQPGSFVAENVAYAKNSIFVASGQAVFKLDRNLNLLIIRTLATRRGEVYGPGDVAALAADHEHLYLSFDGYLIVLSHDLDELGRFSLGIENSKRKNAHHIKIIGNTAFLLVNYYEQVFTIALDVTTPEAIRLMEMKKINTANGYLEHQWVVPKTGAWYTHMITQAAGGRSESVLRLDGGEPRATTEINAHFGGMYECFSKPGQGRALLALGDGAPPHALLYDADQNEVQLARLRPKGGEKMFRKIREVDFTAHYLRESHRHLYLFGGPRESLVYIFAKDRKLRRLIDLDVRDFNMETAVAVVPLE